ncbi:MULTISPECIES: peptidase inhibitor family I36 protein [unclassified Nostoc]|uniref:peptidase inhibitor family I36 protein n=1 Tax=unclassified Nostoc TaxID=2593658 RepID=UPI00391B14FE
MKKISQIGFAVVIGVSVIGSFSRPNVTQAQTVPDCPSNSICVWSERNFTGNLTVIPATSSVLIPLQLSI